MKTIAAVILVATMAIACGGCWLTLTKLETSDGKKDQPTTKPTVEEKEIFLSSR
jgi:uncharacterized protein YdgA (DUF945 family)